MALPTNSVTPTSAAEYVVLLAEEGRSVGTSDKRSVHHADTVDGL